LNKKSGAVAAILEYKTTFEKQMGQQIKKIVTDGGGEFRSQELGKTLKEEGIIYTVSPPYTPQHNGFAEHANRTIIEMTHCFLQRAKVAPEWWGAAVLMAVETTNALPSLSKSCTPPTTLFLKRRINHHFLQTFGFQAGLLKPALDREHKFNAVATEGTLLGYTNDLLAYQIL
jgi:transposase InsO family protein